MGNNIRGVEGRKSFLFFKHFLGYFIRFLAIANVNGILPKWLTNWDFCSKTRLYWFFLLCNTGFWCWCWYCLCNYCYSTTYHRKFPNIINLHRNAFIYLNHLTTESLSLFRFFSTTKILFFLINTLFSGGKKKNFRLQIDGRKIVCRNCKISFTFYLVHLIISLIMLRLLLFIKIYVFIIVNMYFILQFIIFFTTRRLFSEGIFYFFFLYSAAFCFSQQQRFFAASKANLIKSQFSCILMGFEDWEIFLNVKYEQN